MSAAVGEVVEAVEKAKEEPRSRCTGHCCRVFHLPLSPEELWQKYEDWHAQETGDVEPERALTRDIFLIAPMVRLVAAVPDGGASPIDGKPLDWGGGVHHYYRCVHLNENDCEIYEHRPKMCRGFPYGKRCPYLGCTRNREEEEGASDEIRTGGEGNGAAYGDAV